MREGALVVFLFLAGCSVKRPEENASKPAESPIAYSANGWSWQERAEYYHLPEGSELVPYALIANVTSVKTGKPFLQEMDRFGFLPDGKTSTNPYGLPVGLTVARSRNASAQGIEMVGFNCAACHVAEVTYRGKRLRIDGAPGLINLQGYQLEFKDSVDATLKDPKKLLALVIAMEQTQKPGSVDQKADGYVAQAADVAAASTADPNFHAVSSKIADASERPNVSFADRLKEDVAFLKARLAYLKNGKLIVDGTAPGPGRVDAFGAARNFLFPQYALKMQSPVSFPFIWSVPDNTGKPIPYGQIGWIHYDGDTNSILERNIGQALGMGAVFDPKTFESTLRIGNLHRLEVLTHKLQPAQWPADIFGPIDEPKASQGEKIFQDKCTGCHQDKLFSLQDLETDPNRANSFGQTVGSQPFPAAVAPILHSLKERAFQDDGISTMDQMAMDAQPAIWRATGQYLARPLKGIWATAPYLHNGSVPTLYHLVYPDQRPAKFVVGNREYDTQKVGYRTDPDAGNANAWTYDTTQPGNSNIGHRGDRFGTTLSDEQKSALLEYLKKL